MLRTGQPIAAETALDWGLVNRVVPAEALYAQIELDEHRAYDLTKAVMAMNARADDAQEGMCAFLEKRPATWRRR
jgi:enoyl-CoA hydratase/carnithine racemase